MQTHIRNSLKTLGVNGSWQIVLPHKPDPAERTAARELKRLLSGNSLRLKILPAGKASGSKRFLLGQASSSSLIRSLCDNGSLKTATVSDGDDGYHVRSVGKDIAISGANDRSVLYGVYRLIDWLAETGGKKKKLDLFEVPYFKERWMFPGQFGRSDSRAGFRFLARMGVNSTFLHNHWGEPMPLWENAWEFHHLVSETEHLPEIARLAPPKAETVRMVDRAYALSAEYGMNPVFRLLSPPYVEEIHEDLAAHMPPGALTTPWLARERDRCSALCIFHPDVENHFRELVKALLTRYPRTTVVSLYNEDLDTGNCYPHDCPRCRKQHPPGYDDYPWAAHTRQVKVFQEAGREINKSFRILTGTWHWEGDVRHQMLSHFPSDSIVACLNADDCRASTYKLPTWARDICRQTKKRKDLHLFAVDDFNESCEDLLMAVSHGFPLPYRIYRKMHAFAEAGVTGIVPHDLSGPSLCTNSVNDIAYRIFSWDPLMSIPEAEGRIRGLARAQAGSSRAAAWMVRGWKTLDGVLDIWASRELTRLFNNYIRNWITTPIIPLRLKDDGNLLFTVAKGFREGPGMQRRLDDLTAGGNIELLRTALSQVRKAAGTSPDDEQPVYVWDDSHGPITCRRYAELQAEAIEIVLCTKLGELHLLEAGRIGEKTAAFVDIMEKDLANATRLIELLKIRKNWMHSSTGKRLVSVMISQLESKTRLMKLYTK